MNMKKIIYSILSIVSLAALASSCMEIDNFDAPSAKISGNIIDKTTGKNMLLDRADTHVRIWEVSYSLNPTPQDIPVLEDGTFNNERLFAGTYDVLPYDGAYWPCDTTFNVKVGSKSQKVDLEVIPYLHLQDFTYSLDGLNLTMSCRLQAPVTEGLPQVMEIRPFLSLNNHCGAANHIDYYFTDAYKINVRKLWNKLDADGDGVSDEPYTITVPVKAGYTYWIRMGAQVNNTFKNYNYSEVVKVSVPQQ